MYIFKRGNPIVCSCCGVPTREDFSNMGLSLWKALIRQSVTTTGVQDPTVELELSRGGLLSTETMFHQQEQLAKKQN